jgi:hypothetical protein
MLLLFTLHVSLDIRQHFNENNDGDKGEEKEKMKVLLHIQIGSFNY